MENLLAKAKEILNIENNSKDFETIKAFVSEIWRLTFIESFFTCDSLDVIHEKLENIFFNQNNPNELKMHFDIAKTNFLRLYLSRLSLPDIEKYIIKEENSFNGLLFKAFKNAIEEKYFIDANRIGWKVAFYSMMDFLELYGFKNTFYIKRLILSNIICKELDVEVFLSSLWELNPELRRKYESFITKKTISTSKALNILSIILDKNPEIGTFFDLTYQVLNSFSDLHVNISPFINSILIRVFISIDSFMFTNKINAVYYKFEKTIENLSESPLSKVRLTLKTIEFIDRPIRDIQEFDISSSGFISSTRYNADRLTLIGRFTSDCYSNDVFIGNKNLKFSINHLAIISASSGFFLCDMSLQGKFVLKLIGNQETEAFLDTVISIGDEFLMYIETININETGCAIRFYIMSPAYLRSFLFIKLKNNGNSVIIGRQPGNTEGLINEMNHNPNPHEDPEFDISRQHFSVRYENSKILIQNISSLGTDIFLKKKHQFETKAPSDFVKITNNSVYAFENIALRFSLKG